MAPEKYAKNTKILPYKEYVPIKSLAQYLSGPDIMTASFSTD